MEAQTHIANRDFEVLIIQGDAIEVIRWFRDWAGGPSSSISTSRGCCSTRLRVLSSWFFRRKQCPSLN